jgi:hypothetical protein
MRAFGSFKMKTYYNYVHLVCPYCPPVKSREKWKIFLCNLLIRSFAVDLSRFFGWIPTTITGTLYKDLLDFLRVFRAWKPWLKVVEGRRSHLLHPWYEAEDVRRHATIKNTFYVLSFVFIFGLKFYYLERTLGIRDSIVTRLQYGRFGVRIPAREGIFIFSTMNRRSTGRTQPPIQ